MLRNNVLQVGTNRNNQRLPSSPKLHTPVHYLKLATLTHKDFNQIVYRYTKRYCAIYRYTSQIQQILCQKKELCIFSQVLKKFQQQVTIVFCCIYITTITNKKF
eukprot:TRINITY_DN6847_c1_g1_i2.p2 TRINITY_DN6847_c1_g1~~TRINITY_DN6847_c1_g1_i2.p2  ORF type:complete len:104 (-),score=0.27 TRINITY_DN6847_c1_g1_i2:99-410(-)